MEDQIRKHESKTLWVVLLTAVTMVVEIVFGISTKSMALLADGIHMSSHVLAIGLSWFAYVMVRKLSQNSKFSGNTAKILSLSGYTSGILLFVFIALQRGLTVLWENRQNSPVTRVSGTAHR